LIFENKNISFCFRLGLKDEKRKSKANRDSVASTAG